MYNILGELKSEETKLKEGYYLPKNIYINVDIRDIYDIELYFIPRFLLALGKTACLPMTNTEEDKYRIIVNRKQESTYIKSFNDDDLFNLIVERLKDMGIYIGKSCLQAMDNIHTNKFLHLSESQFKDKHHKKKNLDKVTRYYCK